MEAGFEMKIITQNGGRLRTYNYYFVVTTVMVVVYSVCSNLHANQIPKQSLLMRCKKMPHEIINISRNYQWNVCTSHLQLNRN
jgi:hypothetical protein